MERRKKLSGVSGKIYQLCDWLMKLVYVNLLWIIFMMMGLFVFGFFPATTAMFAIIRKWILQDMEVPVFKTFWQQYKQDFVQANLIGLIMISIGLFLYVDLRFFQSSPHFFVHMMVFFIFTLLFIYFVVALYLFPIFVHYDLKTVEYFKYALILSIARPIQTFFMIAGFLTVLLIFRYIPGLIPILFGSVMSLILMKVASLSFANPILNEKELC